MIFYIFLFYLFIPIRYLFIYYQMYYKSDSILNKLNFSND